MRTNQGQQTVQHPWHDDHPLAPNDVRQIRRADGIELALRGVEPLVSGWISTPSSSMKIGCFAAAAWRSAWHTMDTQAAEPACSSAALIGCGGFFCSKPPDNLEDACRAEA